MREAVDKISLNMPQDLEGEYKIEFRSMDIPWIPFAVHNYIAVAGPDGKDIAQIDGMSYDKNGLDGIGSIRFMNDEDRLHLFVLTKDGGNFKHTMLRKLEKATREAKGGALTDYLKDTAKSMITDFAKGAQKAMDAKIVDTVRTTTLKVGNAAEIASMMKVIYGLSALMNDKDMAYVSEPWAANQISNSVAETLAYAITGKSPAWFGLYEGIHMSPGKNRLLLSVEEINKVNALIIDQHHMPLNIFQENIRDIITGRLSYELSVLGSNLAFNSSFIKGHMILDNGARAIPARGDYDGSAHDVALAHILEADEKRYGVLHNRSYGVNFKHIDVQAANCTEAPSNPIASERITL